MTEEATDQMPMPYRQVHTERDSRVPLAVKVH
jgi:hypothetical protein